MNGMGDIQVDVHTLLRTLGPQIDASHRRVWRAASAVDAEEVADLIAEEDERFEIDSRLSAVEREDHARMQLGLEGFSSTVATARTRPTSEQSRRTAASPVCRWRQPRA